MSKIEKENNETEKDNDEDALRLLSGDYGKGSDSDDSHSDEANSDEEIMNQHLEPPWLRKESVVTGKLADPCYAASVPKKAKYLGTSCSRMDLVPPRAPGKSNKKLKKKIWKLLQEYTNEGSLGEKLFLSNNFHDPYALYKIAKKFKIEDNASNYPPELYNPNGFPTTSYYDALRAQQRKEEMKREQIIQKAKGKAAAVAAAAAAKNVSKPLLQLPAALSVQQRLNWNLKGLNPQLTQAMMIASRLNANVARAQAVVAAALASKNTTAASSGISKKREGTALDSSSVRKSRKLT